VVKWQKEKLNPVEIAQLKKRFPYHKYIFKFSEFASLGLLKAVFE